MTIIWKSSMPARPPAKASVKRVLGAPAHDEDAPDEQGEEHEHDHAAQEAELLARRARTRSPWRPTGSRSPVMPLVRPRPSRPPGADRGLRLLELVARAERVGRRVQERDEALLLVVLEDGRPDDRDERPRGRAAQTLSQRRLAPGHEERAEDDGAEDERRAEVGLDEHERRAGAAR